MRRYKNMMNTTRRAVRRSNGVDNDQEGNSLLGWAYRADDDDDAVVIDRSQESPVKSPPSRSRLLSCNQMIHSLLVVPMSCCTSCMSFDLYARRCCRLRILIAVLLMVTGVVVWLHLSYQYVETTWLNAVVRISPFESNATHIKDDEARDGRFCKYKKHRWKCQECYWGKCRPLKKRRHTCPPFKRHDWDEPNPRSRSYHYDDSDHKTQDFLRIPFRLLTRFGITKTWRVEYEQPLCTMASCFNLTKCTGTVLTVYSRPPIYGPLQQLIDDDKRDNLPQHFQLVEDPHEACLIVDVPTQYSCRNDLISTSHWNNGRNHFIWYAACYFFPSEVNGKDRFCDQPFSNVHYGLAALAHNQLTSAHVRFGYDVPLPLPRHWKRPIPLDQVPMASQRSLLLSFRGSVQNTLQPYYQHRWLAAEYWKVDDQENSDVVVNAQCVRRRHVARKGVKNQILHGYDNDNPKASFEYLLLNSTFVFTPGGSGINTYRFGEALSAGAIPVVTPEFVPPFAPELDWSPCLVVVSESRIIDLPRILRNRYQFHQDMDLHGAKLHRNITPRLHQSSINQRQKACLDLLRASMGDKYYDGQDGGDSGWIGEEQVTFNQAMEIMRLRILHSVKYNEETAKLMLPPGNKGKPTS